MTSLKIYNMQLPWKFSQVCCILDGNMTPARQTECSLSLCYLLNHFKDAKKYYRHMHSMKTCTHGLLLISVHYNKHNIANAKIYYINSFVRLIQQPT